ncbi:MAG: DNA methyltransferase [Metallibacterium sp.]
MSNHHKSVFDNEQELLKSLIKIHLDGKNIQLDPMYNKGHFYQDGVKEPDYKFDINIDNCNELLGIKHGDATALVGFADNYFSNMILDPPFLFGIHGKTKEYGCSIRYGIFQDFCELSNIYKSILNEAHRILKKKGILIFKCQDYTDSKTTMVHCLVYNWALELGFYAKDLAILNKQHKIFNGNTIQRHLRKTHTYFWVFEKK